MVGEWIETRVGALLSFANGRSSPDRADGLPYPVYGSNGIIGYASEANSDPGVIIIGRVGSYCGSLYQSDLKCWVTDNAIRAVAKNGNDPRFLYYLLGTLALNNRRAGSGQPLLNQDILSSIPTLVPEPTEQHAIAHILGTLDDKIEFNRRRNQTLEAMAHALFKDWFVDFGPVRAKLEGREPYLPADLWQLFPDRLNDEGKPEGWEAKRVSDFLTLAYGKSLPAGKRNHGNVPVYGSGGITGFHDNALINGPAIIVGRKGTVGSLYWEDRSSFPIDTVFYVQPVVPLSFCYYLLESLPLRNMNTDAAVPGLNRENVYRLEVAGPPAELITAFAQTAFRLRESIAAILRDSETLAQLRDTLLPKLVSGELRIADAERFLEKNAP